MTKKIQKGGNLNEMYSSVNTSILDFFSKLTSNNPEDRIWQSCVFKYTLMTALLIGLSSLILNIITNTGSAMYNTQKYFFIIAFPLVMLFALLLNLGNEQPATYTFAKIAGVLIFVGVGIYYYSQTTGTGIYSLFANYALLTLIVVIALGLAYGMLVKYMSKLTGWPGFIAQLIFYIPCILWNLWLYIFQQFQMTPIAIYALILVEIILIILYIYLPNIVNSVTGLDAQNGIQLINNVYWLDKPKKVLATSDMLLVAPNQQQSSIGQSGQFLSNYCISMWIYVNPQNPSSAAYSKETEIFSYGFTDAKGIQHVKPMIRYYGGGDGSDQLVERDKYVFYFSKYPPTEQYDENAHTFYDLKLQNQKWNQIVLNYNRNVVDLFINGDLERSFHMENEMPEYSPLDNISVGSNGAGIHGAICNVTYYKHPLTTEQIAFSYNMLMNSNPPIPRNPNKVAIDNQ